MIRADILDRTVPFPADYLGDDTVTQAPLTEPHARPGHQFYTVGFPKMRMIGQGLP